MVLQPSVIKWSGDYWILLYSTLSRKNWSGTSGDLLAYTIDAPTHSGILLHLKYKFACYRQPHSFPEPKILPLNFILYQNLGFLLNSTPDCLAYATADLAPLGIYL